MKEIERRNGRERARVAKERERGAKERKNTDLAIIWSIILLIAHFTEDEHREFSVSAALFKVKMMGASSQINQHEIIERFSLNPMALNAFHYQNRSL